MTHKFVFLLYEEVQPMDIIGPWEVIATWKSLYPNEVSMQLVSQEGGLVKCVNGITLQSHTDYKHAFQADYLIVPGGRGRVHQSENKELIKFLQAQAAGSKNILSVCTGTFLLAKAGLLTNKMTTTYWRALPELAEYHQIKISEQRVVKDGKTWSSGGISSGIDLAFALIHDIAGEDVAGEVQLAFEYFPEQKIYAKQKDVQHIPTYPTLSKDTPIRLPIYIKEKLKS